MLGTETIDLDNELLTPLLTDDVFWPSEPRTLAETGLSDSFAESLIGKYLLQTGTSSGRNISEATGLPFGVV